MKRNVATMSKEMHLQDMLLSTVMLQGWFLSNLHYYKCHFEWCFLVCVSGTESGCSSFASALNRHREIILYTSGFRVRHCYATGAYSLLSQSLSKQMQSRDNRGTEGLHWKHCARKYKSQLSKPITAIVVSAQSDWPLCVAFSKEILPMGLDYFNLLPTQIHFASVVCCNLL